MAAHEHSSSSSSAEERLAFRLGAAASALPMLFFVVWAVGICIAGAPDTSGLILGAAVGLALGMLFAKPPWSAYAQAIFTGMSNPVGVVAIVAWLWAGMFAEVLQAGGLVEGLAWVGVETGLRGGWFTGATFVLAALFATAVGTGYGTTVAFCTLLYPAGLLLGSDPLVLFAAVLAGAAFGDNLAPVSDTTIISATTQHTDVPGVVRSRVKYALIAAVPSLILFVVLGGGESSGSAQRAHEVLAAETDPAGLALLVPFVLAVGLALRGHHLLTALTWGILCAIAMIGVLDLTPLSAVLALDAKNDEVTGALVEGVVGYVEMAVLILLIVAAGHIMRAGGAMGAIVGAIQRLAGRSVARGEVASWLIVFVMNAFITVNTAAEIAAAPFVREIGTGFRLHPYRRANLLDATTSALGYIFPWSGGVLLGYQTLRNLQGTYDFVQPVDPTQVWPWVLHGWFLAAVMLTAAVTGFGRTYEASDGSETRTPQTA
jgi:Na+/H+ antiporter NhaC